MGYIDTQAYMELGSGLAVKYKQRSLNLRAVFAEFVGEFVVALDGWGVKQRPALACAQADAWQRRAGSGAASPRRVDERAAVAVLPLRGRSAALMPRMLPWRRHAILCFCGLRNRNFFLLPALRPLCGGRHRGPCHPRGTPAERDHHQRECIRCI